jgi:3,4-dihydroxy 2-butanone 4-phosphate synthase/GTP cyclohydrolase II
VCRVAESTIDDVEGGPWRLIVYRNTIEDVEHLVLLKGPLSPAEPILVRMHSMDPIYDVLAGEASSLHASMRIISGYGRGVIVLIRDPSATGLSRHVQALQHHAAPASELRDYGIGAQILVDLGVRDMIVLSNHHRTIVGIEGYGLNVIGERPIPAIPAQ